MTHNSTFKAGAAKIEITPNVGCWLEGIPRAQPSNALHDPLHARALVIEYSPEGRAGNRICLVSCDLIGVTATFAQEVRQKIGQALGATPANIVVACTHNHSGPAMIGFDNPDHIDKEYLNLLSSKLLQVCQEAAVHLAPALLSVGRGQETTIS